MTSNAKKTAKSEVQEIDTVAGRVETVRTATTDVASAVTAGGRAYLAGIGELGRTVFGFGKELVDDAVTHGKSSIQAKSVRDLAELQVTYAQHRIETGAAHAQEFVELARVKSEDVIAPIVDLVKVKSAA